MNKEMPLNRQLFLYSFISILIIFLIPAFPSAETTDATPDLTKLEIEQLMEIEIATVYGASKFEQKVTEAPSSVTIVTADDIKRYGYRTLADILRSVRGFYVSYDRNYHYAGLRGFARPGDYNTRFLLLVDGHRINDNLYNQATIGTEFILDIDLIERVEIIRGPGSSLYGSNAFLGVINVITKRGITFGGMETSAEAGSFETYKFRASYGNQFKNKMEMLVSGSAYDSKGDDLYFSEFDNPATNNGVAENRDYDRYNSLFSTVSFNNFTLQGAYSYRKKGIPTASFDTIFNDPSLHTIDERWYLDLRYEQTFNEYRVMARLFYDGYYYTGDYPYTAALNKDFGWGKWWGGELKITKNLLKIHKLTFGAEYTDNIRQDQKNYDKDPYDLILDDKRSSDIWAIYLQDEIRINHNILLNLGLRHDRYSTFGGTTNPRLALIYSPFEKTALKLLYGRAFRAPNAYELYYEDAVNIKNNPDLEPETINTYEMILEQYIGNNLILSASGFYYKIKDLITFQTDPSDPSYVQFQNTDEAVSRGIALELEHKWHSGVRGKIIYTFQETKDLQTRDILTNSPKHLAKLNLLVPLIKEKVFSGLEIQHTGKRKTLGDDKTDAFFVTNLTLSMQKLIRGLEGSVSVYNIFDKHYKDPGSEEHIMDAIEQDGRTFRAKLTYRF